MPDFEAQTVRSSNPATLDLMEYRITVERPDPAQPCVVHGTVSARVMNGEAKEHGRPEVDINALPAARLSALVSWVTANWDAAKGKLLP